MNSRFKVGDTVFITDVNFGRSTTTIAKVGRKWVYVTARDQPFDPKTGVIHDEYGHARIMTRAEADREDALARADKALRAHLVEAWRMKPERRFALYAALRPLFEAWDAEDAAQHLGR